MKNKLLNVKLSMNGTIKSTELVEIINTFREVEDKSILQHKDFMKKIRKELETLKTLGLEGEGKISPTYYNDKQGKERECYELNKDGMLEMLNSESVLVRVKTIEYINKLENELNKVKTLPTYSEALRQLADKIEENEKLELENKHQKQKIGELQPKADYTDEILKSKGTITTTQISKDYGLSAKRLNEILNDNKVQYKQNGQWLLYSKYQTCGYTKSNTFVDKNGTSRINTKWTQKGRLFINSLLNKIGIKALIEKEN